MARWQTTVSGNTISAVVDAARSEIDRFFEVAEGGDRRPFEVDITDAYHQRGHRGELLEVEYEAVITVTW